MIPPLSPQLAARGRQQGLNRIRQEREDLSALRAPAEALLHRMLAEGPVRRTTIYAAARGNGIPRVPLTMIARHLRIRMGRLCGGTVIYWALSARSPTKCRAVPRIRCLDCRQMWQPTPEAWTGWIEEVGTGELGPCPHCGGNGVR